MAMDANFSETQPVSEHEVDDGAHCLHDGEIGKFWQANDDHRVSKTNVRRFYFVKVWPCNDTYGEFKIKEAEKVIEEINQRRNPIYEAYSKIQNARSELDYLGMRESHFLSAVKWKEWKLDNLQAALDKLNLAKIAACKRGATTSSSTATSEECNFHVIKQIHHYQMFHGSNNLATEKKLLKRQIPRSQDDDIISSCSVDDLKDFIEWFYGRIKARNSTTHQNILKEIKNFEEKIEKAKADAAQKGKVWGLRTSRKTIQDQINLVNRIMEEIRKDHWEIIVEMKRLEKGLNRSEKEESILKKRLDDTAPELHKAFAYIYNVRKQLDQANAGYHEYVSILSQAKELASKKDVASLEQLSRTQVHKFVSQWNSNKAFRKSCTKKILPSLKDRQLSRDGRMDLSNDEELACSIKTNQNDDFDNDKL